MSERPRRRYVYRDFDHFIELLAETPMMITPYGKKAMELAWKAARMVEDVPEQDKQNGKVDSSG